jgi:hypothetical protein
MNASTVQAALTSFIPQIVPEAILGLGACVLFLGATWRIRRHVWGIVALVSLLAAGVALYVTFQAIPTVEATRAHAEQLTGEEQKNARETLIATIYAAPVLFSRLALFFKVVALVGGVVLVLFSWDDAGESTAPSITGACC